MLNLNDIMDAEPEDIEKEIENILREHVWAWVGYIEGGYVGKKPKSLLVNVYRHDTLTDENYR